MQEITLNGPGKNALGTDMLRLVLARLREAKGAPLLITGHGDAFSAGLNLKEVARLDDPGMRAFLELLEEAISALYFYPGPTTALINGHAIAGGCILALVCDRRGSPPRPSLTNALTESALRLPVLPPSRP